MRRGLLIILSSPSGAGKSTLARRLMRWDPSLAFSVSATTRAMRTGEVDGQDYFFVEEADFKRQVRDGEMLEHAHVFGKFYGSPKAPVEAAIRQGQDVLFDMTGRAHSRSPTPHYKSMCFQSSSCRLPSQNCNAGLRAGDKTPQRS